MTLLQIRVLHLIRILAKGDRDASEAVNDILAQVGYFHTLDVIESHLRKLIFPDNVLYGANLVV